MSNETITWLRVTAEQPPDDVLVMVTGYIRNDSAQGRWRGMARRHGDVFIEDAGDVGFGESFFPPTHYFVIPEPPNE